MTQPEIQKPRLDRERIRQIIFEAEDPVSRGFDIILLIAIFLSVITVMIESIPSVEAKWNTLFLVLEWFFTIIFTIEYILRLYTVKKPWAYATSFYGVIDLLAIIPTYLTLFLVGTQYLIVIRALRLLRVFRIFKLGHFMGESRIIIEALKASRAKIFVFLFFIMLLVTIIGSIMYLVEGGPDSPFDSIPRSIYWAIVTLTTVGFGDITPQTNFGQFLSAIVMILGYAVIAVPTGIVSSEFISSQQELSTTTISCPGCGHEGHADDAKYCKFCGEALHI